MIEKRRRDRINNSLNELRRLVPAAFEKQGSAKLEKAEILQMTVDHLTMLHAKGNTQHFLILCFGEVVQETSRSDPSSGEAEEREDSHRMKSSPK